MRNQQVTYSTSRHFEISSESLRVASPHETQGPREVGHKECSISLHLIAVALGILCLLLMMAIAVWLTYISQYSGNKHELQKTLNNLTQKYQTLQSNNSLMKEMLRNKSIELDDFKRQKELNSSNREQNRCCGETNVLDHIWLTGKYVGGYWFCSGIKCYFIMDNKHWSGCKQTCQDCSLSLLKIDDDDELKFLQVKVNANSNWIGLSFDTGKSKWQWIDNGPSNL
ncbi:killer cell lectin-like receptor 2 [Chionomys nivalis]|uniref:killer cell lectin-like receptor 2 n=1 Tax=Chionomys nivalis TaxID=269649 RepID=UPI0025985ED0|nr:killer cell lectin-like receptor 2 [Chionomys nivalis]